MFCKSINEKITAYLRPVQMKSKKYCIESRLVKSENWEYNINLPIFDTFNQANGYLKRHYQFIKEEKSNDIQ